MDKAYQQLVSNGPTADAALEAQTVAPENKIKTQRSYDYLFRNALLAKAS